MTRDDRPEPRLERIHHPGQFVGCCRVIEPGQRQRSERAYAAVAVAYGPGQETLRLEGTECCEILGRPRSEPAVDEHVESSSRGLAGSLAAEPTA